MVTVAIGAVQAGVIDTKTLIRQSRKSPKNIFFVYIERAINTKVIVIQSCSIDRKLVNLIIITYLFFLYLYKLYYSSK